MFKIFRSFRNLKMSSQVILFGSLIMALILLIILGTCLIQASILFKAIQSSSQAITTKQEKRSIEMTALRIQEYLGRKYHQAIDNIIHIEKFFEATKHTKQLHQSSQLFLACENSNKKKNIRYDTDHFCYQSLFNSDGITLPDNEQINEFNRTVSLLNEYTLLFDVTTSSQLYIFDLPKPQMIISYPQSYQVKNYNISTRPWYLKILYRYKSYQNQSITFPHNPIYYTPVFMSTIQKELVMAVISTIDKNSPIGFAAQTFAMSDQNIKQASINVILANDEGSIILTSIDSINTATDQITIYNSTYTGFNESDWEKIKARSSDVDQPANYCQGFPNTFCLYNQYFKKNVQVDALKIIPENFTLIVFVNVTFSSQLDEQFKQLTEALSKQIVQIEWIQIIVCLVMIAITVAMIYILFLPLFQLMKAVQLHIRTLGNNLDKQIFTMTRKLGPKSNIFSKLSIKFLSLQDLLGKSQIQKSDLCLKIENFQYNRKQSVYDLSKIKSIIEEINENQSSPIKRSAISQFKSQCKSFYDVFNIQLNELYLINQ